MNTRFAPVTGVIPVQNPDMEALSRTVESLASQSKPPEELIIVDSSPDRPVAVSTFTPFPTHIIHRPDLAERGRTIPLQRRIGIAQARAPYIWRLDEDAVFDSHTHLEQLMQDLDRPGVVAACSRVAPLDRSPSGRLAAAVMSSHPAYGLFPVYPRSLCPNGTNCYPHDTTAPFSPRASDVTFVRHLLSHGRVYRNDSLVARTTLPMARQRKMMRAGAGLALAGAVAAFGGV